MSGSGDEGAAWDRDRADPSTATGTDDLPPAAGGDEIVDLTGRTEAVADGPPLAGNPHGELLMEDDQEDRSIRELFWGED